MDNRSRKQEEVCGHSQCSPAIAALALSAGCLVPHHPRDGSAIVPTFATRNLQPPSQDYEVVEGGGGEHSQQQQQGAWKGKVPIAIASHTGAFMACSLTPLLQHATSA